MLLPCYTYGASPVPDHPSLETRISKALYENGLRHTILSEYTCQTVEAEGGVVEVMHWCPRHSTLHGRVQKRGGLNYT